MSPEKVDLPAESLWVTEIGPPKEIRTTPVLF
jgi:hypothetical protein